MCVHVSECVYIYIFFVVPKILQFPESVSVKEREKVVFQVEVTGAPEPTLTWYHDGEEMVSDASRRQAKDGSLTIPSAETKHSGVYQLVAVNPAGTVEREVKLSVEEDSNSSPPPQPQQTTSALSVAFFGNHVETSHSNQNQAFKEQYQVNTTQPALYTCTYKLRFHLNVCMCICVCTLPGAV